MPVPLCEDNCIFSCPDGSYHNEPSYNAGIPLAEVGGDCCGANVTDACVGDIPTSMFSNAQIVQKRRIPPLGPKSRMRSATGLSEKQVGGTMALYAYLGTALGTYAAMRYLGVLNKSTHKIGIAGAMIFAGLALGSKIGAIRVEQKRGK